MKRTLTLLSILALTLAACGEPGEQASSDPTTTAWVLDSGTLDGAEVPIVDGYPITLVFDEDGQAGGKSACNNYFAGYTIAAAEISFDDAGQTMMACTPEEVMTSESTFMTALGRVESFSSDGEQLTLTGDGVELVFVVDESAQS
jgi:heat shock protein HslJ